MVCEHCGSALTVGAAVCPVCGTPVQAGSANPAEIAVKENVLMGTVGALVGALLGGASIILFNMIGSISALSGVLIAFATLKGYEKLGKTLSKKGIVISAIFMLIIPLVASYIGLGYEVFDAFKGYGASFGECIALLPELMTDGTIDMSVYFSNLGMLYLFVIIGGFSIVRNAVRKV